MSDSDSQTRHPSTDTPSAALNAGRYTPDPDLVTRLNSAISGIGRNILGPGVEHHIPVDHFQVIRDGEAVATTVTLRGEADAIGRYSAPSKLGVYISTLFHLAQGDPMLEAMNRTAAGASAHGHALRAFRSFQKEPDRTHSKAEGAIIRAFNEVVDVLEQRWQADPETLSDSVRGLEANRESYRAQVIDRNRIRSTHGLSDAGKGHVMAVDPREIVLPPKESDFRIYEKPWPDVLSADDLNVGDFLTRPERHQEGMIEPDPDCDESWKADENSRWLLKGGEIIATYAIGEKRTRALLATYLSPEVPLAVRNGDGTMRQYQSMSLWVNVGGFRGGKCVVKLSSNSVAIAIVEFDPHVEDHSSSDEKWKRIVSAFAHESLERTIREAEYFNKLDMLVEKPQGTATLEGTIHVKNVRLHVATAAEVSQRVGDTPSDNLPGITPQPERGVERHPARSSSWTSRGRDSAGCGGHRARRA